MADQTDVVVSAYAAASEAKAGTVVQPLKLFAEPPQVLHVEPEGSGSVPKQFGNALKRYSGLGQFLAARGTGGASVRRVALNTFSAGYAVAKWALTRQASADLVDAALFLDSLAIDRLPSGDFWVNAAYEGFLRSAAEGGPGSPLVISACTAIPSLSKLVGSTEASTHWVLDQAEKWRREVGSDSPAPLFNWERFNAPLPHPVTITGGNPSSSFTWPQWPQPQVRQVGNIVGLFFGGTGGPAHIFQAWWVQPRVWGLLADWWAPGPCAVRLDGTVPICSSAPSGGRALPKGEIVLGSGRTKGGGSAASTSRKTKAALGVALGLGALAWGLSRARR